MSLDFERIADVFEGARTRRGDARDAYLDEACGDDDALRSEVEALLEHDVGDDGLSDEALDDVRRQMSRVSTDSVPRTSLAMPERIGEFTVVRRIGAGGMGVVYEALQERPRRSVAIKLLRPTLLVESLRRRFEREAEILARLRHPGIAQVYETGTCDLGDGEQPYFAMELVEGRDLTSAADELDLDVRARLDLVVGICEAVHHAHTRGIVHRDLKPDNVLVDADDRPRILDFGVSHAVSADGAAAASLQTAEGDIVGTLDYMAPEQVTGGDAARAPAIDVYAIGAMLYELLSGRTPHDLSGLSLVAAARVVGEGVPTPLRRAAPNVATDVTWIVDKALATDPARRYDSALALADELRRYLAGEPVRARPPSALYLFERFVSRNRFAAAGLAFAFVSLVGGLVVSLILFAEARASSVESARQAKKSAAINEYVLERMLSSFSPLDMGRDVRVVDVLDLAAPAIDETFADEPEIAAAVRVTLGRSYYQLGLWDEADALLSKAHADLTRLVGPDHPETLDAGSAWTRALMSLDQRELGLATCEATLAGARDQLGDDARETVELRSLHGRLLFEAGDREEGLIETRSALDDAERLFGLDELTLEVRYGLAVMESMTGELESSLERVESYLEDLATLHDAGNPREVAALGQLANNQMMLGRSAEAVETSALALDRSREQFGDDHPTTIFTLSTHASLLAETGAFEDARGVSLECIDSSRRLLGDMHRTTLRVRSNHAILLRRMNELDAALELASEVLEKRIEALGPEDVDVAQGYDVLAAIHIEREEYEDADAALAEALATMRAALGDDAPEVADILYNRASMLSRQDRLDEAEVQYRELYETEVAIYGPLHPFPLADRYQIGRVLARGGRDAEAIPELEAALEGQRRVHDPRADDVLRTLTTLGKCLVACDRHDEAVPLLEEALSGMEALEDERMIEQTHVREHLAEARRGASGSD